MKNIFVYYLAIVIPFAIILFLPRTHTISPNWFLCLLLFYILIYRTYIDGKRLADKGIIKHRDIWKMIIPGQRLRFFRDLYLRWKMWEHNRDRRKCVQLRTSYNNMFALWPGDWLNFSNFKLQRLVSWDNARLRKPATSQTQTLAASTKKIITD